MSRWQNSGLAQRAGGTYPRAIVGRLKATDSPVIVQVSDRIGTWNPARKEVAGRLFANGTAEYTLDESGNVHLCFSPATGPDQRYDGPIPTFHDSPECQRRRRLLRRAWIAYLTWLLIGIGIGLAIAHGSIIRHLVFAVGGLFLFTILASFIKMTVLVVLAIRTTLREQTK